MAANDASARGPAPDTRKTLGEGRRGGGVIPRGVSDPPQGLPLRAEAEAVAAPAKEEGGGG